MVVVLVAGGIAMTIQVWCAITEPSMPLLIAVGYQSLWFASLVKRGAFRGVRKSTVAAHAP